MLFAVLNDKLVAGLIGLVAAHLPRSHSRKRGKIGPRLLLVTNRMSHTHLLGAKINDLRCPHDYDVKLTYIFHFLLTLNWKQACAIRRIVGS